MEEGTQDVLVTDIDTDFKHNKMNGRGKWCKSFCNELKLFLSVKPTNREHEEKMGMKIN